MYTFADMSCFGRVRLSMKDKLPFEPIFRAKSSASQASHLRVAQVHNVFSVSAESLQNQLSTDSARGMYSMNHRSPLLRTLDLNATMWLVVVLYESSRKQLSSVFASLPC